MAWVSRLLRATVQGIPLARHTELPLLVVAPGAVLQALERNFVGGCAQRSTSSESESGSVFVAPPVYSNLIDAPGGSGAVVELAPISRESGRGSVPRKVIPLRYQSEASMFWELVLFSHTIKLKAPPWADMLRVLLMLQSAMLPIQCTDGTNLTK